MARRITVIEGHPDPSPTSLNHALAERYANAAQAAGSEVRRVVVGDLDFPLLRSANDYFRAPPPESIAKARNDIFWADHIVLFYPLWVSDVPALLKGFIEQAFRPDAPLEIKSMRRPPQFLRGKSFRFVVTTGMPAPVYRWFFGAHSLKSLERIVGFSGGGPIHDVVIGGVEAACERTRAHWFEQMIDCATADSRTHSAAAPPLSAPRVLSQACVIFGTAYLAFAAATWLRYGNRKRISESGDPLIDRVMPEYEVSTSRSIRVHAPVGVTFATIRDTDLIGSPLVRVLLRSREVLMGSNHEERVLHGGLLAQAKEIGWSQLAEEPGHAIVMGTVTQPWKPNPRFSTPLLEEFLVFAKPGYAKIAFSIGCDPLEGQSCVALTETRVRTTDPISRGRFRRYWAFVLPGIELIRIALLQQVKREAEARWRELQTRQDSALTPAPSPD